MSLRSRMSRIRSQIEKAAVDQLDAAVAEERRLRRAVATGDESVSASDLAEAKAAIDLAELKVANARRVAAEEAEKARLHAIESFVEQASGAVSPMNDLAVAVAEHRAAATAALRELYEAAQQHHVALVGLAQTGAALGLDQHNDHGVRVRTQSDAVAVRVGHDEVHDVDPLDRVAQVVADVLGEGPHVLQVEANRSASRANRVDAGDVVRIPVMSPAQIRARGQRRHRASVESGQQTQRAAEERYLATTPPEKRGTF